MKTILVSLLCFGAATGLWAADSLSQSVPMRYYHFLEQLIGDTEPDWTQEVEALFSPRFEYYYHQKKAFSGLAEIEKALCAFRVSKKWKDMKFVQTLTSVDGCSHVLEYMMLNARTEPYYVVVFIVSQDGMHIERIEESRTRLDVPRHAEPDVDFTRVRTDLRC